MPEPPARRLDAVTTYGRGGAGARVRVFEWLDRLDLGDPVDPVSPRELAAVGEPAELAAVVHSYLGTSDNARRTLLRRPAATARAERAVRALARRDLDRLLVFRQASPFGRGGLEEALLRRAAWGVYDFDDGLQWDLRSRLGRVVRSSTDKCLRSVTAADRVIAGNDELADWASRHARDVVVVPSCVDPSRFEVKADYEVAARPRLVWIGSPSGESYVESIAGALLRVHDLLGARVTIIGDAAGTFTGPLQTITDRVQWVDGRAERQLAGFDVGLGPLTDDPFSRGKSAYKLLQYGAAGLPFVASPVATNEVVARALGGRAASTEGEWVEQVVDLLTAPAATRRAMGAAAAAVVRRAYSFDAWADRWLDALGLGGTRLRPRGAAAG